MKKTSLKNILKVMTSLFILLNAAVSFAQNLERAKPRTDLSKISHGSSLREDNDEHGGSLRENNEGHGGSLRQEARESQ